MPIIDDERDVVVLRVVYDGPPLCGKTTTLRTLAQGLGAEVSTPQERGGRTLYFDWLEYEGGLFEGRRIRCQIVSVPGQLVLGGRRRLLLESADAVVLVVDTRPEALDQGLGLLRELVSWGGGREPPVGVVVQANKRDDPRCVPSPQLRSRLAEIAPAAVVETVATAGEGIRETFVFGVRLALERTRELAEAGALARGRPEVDDAQQLLEQIERAESRSGTASPPRPSGAEQRRLQEELDGLLVQRDGVGGVAAHEDGEPGFVLDPLIPSGFIWPPVNGRALLREASVQALVPVRTRRGAWWASRGGWRLHSDPQARYEDAVVGRSALIEWARLHASNLYRLSGGRALLLGDAGRGRVRLWQLVRIEPALRELLLRSVACADASRLAAELVEATALLEQARRSLHVSQLPLPCTLWTVGRNAQQQATFVGLMPGVGQPVGDDADGLALIEREFLPLLRVLQRVRDDYDQLREALERAHEREPDHVGVEALVRLTAANR